MPFPEINRVIYQKNPLTDVICQFRFPPILRIDSEVPSNFQEKLRDTFPLYREKNEISQQLAPANSPDAIQQFMAKLSIGKNHEFLSADEAWKINLTRTFVALSTTQYSRWEIFLDKMQSVIKPLLDIYAPPFFTRLGLRYVDVFNRSMLGLGDVAWSELIDPHFVGLLSTAFEENIQSCESVYEVKLLDEISLVRIATSFVIELATKEKCYKVDSDFYTPKRILPPDAFKKLDFLHDRSTRLIRLIIKDRLHDAMEPREI
jgi:uncharacterized protein (TIGR04255 family)